MTDRPIKFKAEMVRALLDGRKTQTRRLIKPQPPRWVETMGFTCMTPAGHISGRGASGTGRLTRMKSIKLPCVAGDRLWVKELWRADAQMDDIEPRNMSMGEPIEYVADGARRTTGCLMIDSGKVRPPSHMPRWASRITLTVKKVRAQRLQDISESDAEAEGVIYPGLKEYDPDVTPNSFRYCFSSFWHDIHPDEGGGFSWSENPWVTAITFTVEHANIDGCDEPNPS